MVQNESSQGQTDRASSSSKNPIAHSSVTQARIIQVLKDENREKEELIKRQREIILKKKEEETAAILRQQKKILENEKKIVLQALEEESFAKKKAIVEKERVVREKERQLKEQEKMIQIQQEELEKHKEITKNVLEEVVQRQTKNPPKRFNHQYNFNEKPTSSKVETKLQNMQIGSKDKFTANNENKSKKLNKANDIRQWSNDQKSVRREPQTRQNVNFGHQQMFNQPSNFQNPTLNSMAAYPEAYPPFPHPFGQNMTYAPFIPDPRFTNVNVPPPNLPHLTKQSATNIHATNSKENSSHRNKVYQKSVSKSDSDKRSMTDDKYDQVSAAASYLKKNEERDSDSDKNSTSDTKNKSRRRRRYGRDLNSNEVAKAKELDNNAKKPDKRMIGYFQCPQCSKTWKSATTYIGVTQQCARCRIDVVPTKLESMNKHREDLCGKCKVLGHNCREKATSQSAKVPGERENIDEYQTIKQDCECGIFTNLICEPFIHKKDDSKFCTCFDVFN